MSDEMKTTIGTCKTCGLWARPSLELKGFLGRAEPPIEVNPCSFLSAVAKEKASKIPLVQVPPYFPDLPGVLPLATPEFFGCIWWTQQADQKGGEQE